MAEAVCGAASMTEAQRWALRSVIAFWRVMPVVWPPEVVRLAEGVMWISEEEGLGLVGGGSAGIVCFSAFFISFVLGEEGA